MSDAPAYEVFDFTDKNGNLHKVRELPNGAYLDIDTGKIVGNPGGGKAAITEQTAGAMIERRWEKHAQDVAEGIIEGTKAEDLSGGIKRISKALTEIAITEGKRPAVAASELLFKMLDIMPQRNTANANSDTITLQLPASELRALISDLRAARSAGDAVDSTARDVTDDQ